MGNENSHSDENEDIETNFIIKNYPNGDVYEGKERKILTKFSTFWSKYFNSEKSKKLTLFRSDGQR